MMSAVLGKQAKDDHDDIDVLGWRISSARMAANCTGSEHSAPRCDVGNAGSQELSLHAKYLGTGDYCRSNLRELVEKAASPKTQPSSWSGSKLSSLEWEDVIASAHPEPVQPVNSQTDDADDLAVWATLNSSPFSSDGSEVMGEAFQGACCEDKEDAGSCCLDHNSEPISLATSRSRHSCPLPSSLQDALHAMKSSLPAEASHTPASCPSDLPPMFHYFSTCSRRVLDRDAAAGSDYCIDEEAFKAACELEDEGGYEDGDTEPWEDMEDLWEPLTNLAGITPPTLLPPTVELGTYAAASSTCAAWPSLPSASAAAEIKIVWPVCVPMGQGNKTCTLDVLLQQPAACHSGASSFHADSSSSGSGAILIMAGSSMELVARAPIQDGSAHCKLQSSQLRSMASRGSSMSGMSMLPSAATLPPQSAPAFLRTLTLFAMDDHNDSGPAIGALCAAPDVAEELNRHFAHMAMKLLDLEHNPATSHVHLRDLHGYTYLPGAGGSEATAGECFVFGGLSHMQSMQQLGHLQTVCEEDGCSTATSSMAAERGPFGRACGDDAEAPPRPCNGIEQGLPPWLMTEPERAACAKAWACHFQPLVREISYLLTCVPGAFPEQQQDWDQRMYCRTLAGMVAFLEYYQCWHTLAALLEHAGSIGVAFCFQGEQVSRSSISAKFLEKLLRNALHDDIGIQYTAVAAAAYTSLAHGVAAQLGCATTSVVPCAPVESSSQLGINASPWQLPYDAHDNGCSDGASTVPNPCVLGASLSLHAAYDAKPVGRPPFSLLSLIAPGSWSDVMLQMLIALMLLSAIAALKQVLR